MSGDSAGGDPMAVIQQLNNVQAKTPPWLEGVTPQTLPQAMPGQLEAIAKQLGMGFGTKNVGQAQFMKHLDQVYDPVQSMNFDPTKKPVPKVDPKPTPRKPMDPYEMIVMPDGTRKPAWQTGYVRDTGMPRTSGRR